ncbi:unnamed protein product [Diabrotica balteata]|uniref:Gamma-interferon-inducible lysosomal thiol reductase n=1 Tax=Diabrotica balteata TaxID=107213 RepID=A0A9N9X7P0_DIABA|nr:unnamed protein product [Diabrotica balteata]
MESVTVLIVVLCFAGISVQATDLKVSIYYESLCPDSIAFLKNQFYPAYSTVLKNKIKVDLVPFGKATATKNDNGTWTFTCQHKERECYGNKVQSCAIDIASYNTSIEYVVCAMRSGDAANDEVLKEVQATDLKVSIYYESLCPDSIAFIKNQFYPAYSTVLQDKIKVDLVPFGKATATKSDNGTWTFTCQHKEPECYGNKIQSCAIDIASYNTSIEFVVCAMKSGNASNNDYLKECAEENQIKWEDIENCIKTGKGDELLAKYGDRTNAVTPKITFIPTIVFNDVYSAARQTLALTNFLEVTEVLLEEPNCAKCSSSIVTLSIAVLLLPLISMLKLH